MRPGTPGFRGANLREARDVRQLTALALAELVGVTAASISQYERGKQTPGPETMAALANTLNLPVRFFLEPAIEAAHGSAVFYRSLASATKSVRERAEIRYRWFRELVAFVERFVDFPAPDFPAAFAAADPRDLSDETIEDAAAATRRHWRIGAGVISDVTLLLENAGALVTQGTLGSEKLDAFSQWVERESRPYLFIGSDKLCAARGRFNASHELGHVILHRFVPQQLFSRPEIHKLAEVQANRFGGAFLLPEASFLSDVFDISLDGLRLLKEKWKVSIGVMIYRLADLSVITEDRARSLWVGYRRRGWHKREPFDDAILPEQPRAVRRAVELLIAEGVVSRSQFVNALRFGPREIEDLAGLSRGYLSRNPNDDAPIIDLRSRFGGARGAKDRE